MNNGLNNLSLQELWQLFPIVLKRSAYAKWRKQYDREEKNLINLLNNDIYRITHIGSTAVKGLTAKPIIDILLEVNSQCDTDKLKENMCNNGYICLKQDIPPHMMFIKGYTPQGFAKEVFHVHIRFAGTHPQLYFRDYLKEHKSARKQYAKLKKELAKKYKHHRDNYTYGKTKFIEEINLKAIQLYKDKYMPK